MGVHIGNMGIETNNDDNNTDSNQIDDNKNNVNEVINYYYQIKKILFNTNNNLIDLSQIQLNHKSLPIPIPKK